MYRQAMPSHRCRPILSSLGQRRLLTSSSTSFPTGSQFNRSDFTGQPFTGSYEPGLPTTGPLASTPAFGAPRITSQGPEAVSRSICRGTGSRKKGIEGSKTCKGAKKKRKSFKQSVNVGRLSRVTHWKTNFLDSSLPLVFRLSPKSRQVTPLNQAELVDNSPLQIEKSNILLLGPSGVGKTLMAKTLARVLSVPFSISDCTPFTQAGYIGEDAETCVHRLLAAANYDVEQAERGIIVLDEIDKIASAKVSHGKDVGGEGVQQALLKIIEGTTIQVQAKSEKNTRSASPPNSYPSNSPLGNTPFPPHNNQAAKGEVYNVRTDNILFIFSGAFMGLHKVVMDRISKGSIGFGQPVRAATSSSDQSGPSASSPTEPIPITPGSEEEALYKKHLPFFTSAPSGPGNEPNYFNALDLVNPTDLQTYGFIPELIGRIPVTAALSTLTQPLLLRILTEPRNSLLAQYTTLFSLSGIELRFTTPALHRIAANGFTMGTGARALRTEMETILSDAMFEAPGSSVKFVLVTEAVADRKEKPIYLARGQGGKFHAMISAEESEWEEKTHPDKKGKEKKENLASDDGTKHATNFQEYRKRAHG
ncbi:hypothetical protein N7450_005059 [Penicillium hetheringtonii]|uniref:ATP-dependent Clp protease n=1 Tax=Penicillium hetheringtonii TaxID=911720 RepID=A0AAD6DSN1_9EURO|nr:hypothetical protein N7450_005059 [Penicillium hetheringtonii]